MAKPLLLQFSVAFLAAGAQNPNNISNTVVVFTGITLVFFILVILIAIITIQGKIFSRIDEKNGKSAKKSCEEPQALQIAPPPVVESGIKEEIVAAIIAAISAENGSGFTLRSVKKIKKERGNWGFAGLVQTTKPF